MDDQPLFEFGTIFRRKSESIRSQQFIKPIPNTENIFIRKPFWNRAESVQHIFMERYLLAHESTKVEYRTFEFITKKLRRGRIIIELLNQFHQSIQNFSPRREFGSIGNVAEIEIDN